MSGLSEWIGEQFSVLGELPVWLVVTIVCVITAFLTEITSNAATCTILMPIVAALVGDRYDVIRHTHAYEIMLYISRLPNSAVIPDSVTLF